MCNVLRTKYLIDLFQFSEPFRLLSLKHNLSNKEQVQICVRSSCLNVTATPVELFNAAVTSRIEEEDKFTTQRECIKISSKI